MRGGEVRFVTPPSIPNPPECRWFNIWYWAAFGHSARVPSGGGLSVAICRTRYGVCRVSAQGVPRAYRSASGRSERLSSLGAVAVLALEWKLNQLADRFVAIDRGW